MKRALYILALALVALSGSCYRVPAVEAPSAPVVGLTSLPNSLTPLYFASLLTSYPVTTSARDVRILDGYAATNDGGGGVFTWIAGSTKTADSCTFVRPTGYATGGWQRVETTGAPGNNRIEAAWCGGAPDANFQNPANGNWFQDVTYSVPATDRAVTLRRAEAAVKLLGVGSVHVGCGNWLLLTADPAATQNEYITLASNVSWFGDGDCSALRIPGGVTTGSSGYAAIFGINPTTGVATPSTWAVNNVRISRLLFDHNSAFNKWGGANFNGIGTQSQTAAVGIPVGDNDEIDNNTVENFNGTFAFVGGTYQYQNLATRIKIHDNHLWHIADDPNMGDSSFIAAGFTRGSIDHNRIEMGPNVGCGIAGITSNAGAMKVQTSCAHGLVSTTGGGVYDGVVIKGAAASSNANGYWSMTVNDSTHFTLTGSTYAATSTTGTIDAVRGATAIEAHCVDADISDNLVQGPSVCFNIYADSNNSGPMRIMHNYCDEVQAGIVIAAITGKTLSGVTAGENTVLVRPGNSATGAEWGISFGTDTGSYTGSLIQDFLIRGNFVSLAYGSPYSAGNSYGIPGGGNLSRGNVTGNTSVSWGTAGYRLNELVAVNTANYIKDVHIVGNTAHNPRLYGVELDGFANTLPHTQRLVVTDNVATQDTTVSQSFVQNVFVGQQIDHQSIISGNYESNSSGITQPNSISGLVLWLQSTYGTTSSIFQSAWNDQSTGGFNFAQSVYAQQPYLPPPGSRTPEFEFTGTQALTNNSTVTGGAWTVGIQFHLTSLPGAATGTNLFTFEMGSNTFGEIDADNLGGYQPYTFMAKVAGAAASSGIANALDLNMHNLIVTYNNGTNTTPGSYTAVLDGTAQTVVASGSLGRTGTDLGSIGGRVTSGNVVSAGASVGIRKILVYSSNLTGSNLTSLELLLGSPP